MSTTPCSNCARYQDRMARVLAAGAVLVAESDTAEGIAAKRIAALEAAYGELEGANILNKNALRLALDREKEANTKITQLKQALCEAQELREVNAPGTDEVALRWLRLIGDRS